jgi:UDP-N-acetylglucosamine--N-acetylmuramyl-(pentapeptide) pyrophosphoryl-undecaprenol N-acetylglucosamine transferase
VKVFAVIVAGGTGGHINAALALGERLLQQGHQVHYLTGMRPLDHKLFLGTPVTHLESWPLRNKNPARLLLALIKNTLVFIKILFRFIGERPRFIVGCGGYVCGPTLVAGKMLGVPVFILEQNAVLGLTNRLLAKPSDLIFTHFNRTRGVGASLQKKIRVVGNPTRQSISYSPPRQSTSSIRILVFGGSLGAQQLNDMTRAWVTTAKSSPIEVIHQTGPGEQPRVSLGANVSYYALPYLDKIQEQYAWCDMVVARAGASTISELRIVQRPAFLVPFPGATDNHQYWNATLLKEENRFPVEVVDPMISPSDLLAKFDSFVLAHHTNRGQSSQSVSTVLDSAQLALAEIFQHVGIAQKS